MLDNKQQSKIAQLVQEELKGICKLQGLDYYDLDSDMRDSLLMAFQAGVGFVEKIKAEEINKEIKKTINYECEHLDTTMVMSPYKVTCNNCGKQWDEQEWTDYKENEKELQNN